MAVREVPRFLRWVLVIGVIPIIGSAALAARLIWEQTFWSWARGPQMVGFALVHGSGAILMLFPLLLMAWLLIVATAIVWILIRKRRIPVVTWILIGVSICVLAAISAPYGFWQRLFVSRIVAGPYAAGFLTQAAAIGDLETVKVFMLHGVPVGASTREGTTAIHAASVGGKIKVIEYLLSKGADINALDRYEDSPLEKAISMKHDDTVKYLIEHGAKRIVGNEALRNKVTEEIVREDIKTIHILDESGNR